MSKTEQKHYKLSELIAYFETCNRAEGKSQRTVSWYSLNLKYFNRYLQEKRCRDSLEEINIGVLREFVLHLLRRVRYENHPHNYAKGEPLSAYTVHGYVRTLRAFFSWMVREGILTQNVAQHLKPPKLPKKVIATLTNEEIEGIFNLFDRNNSGGARNQTILTLLLDTGLRIGELVNLKTRDVHAEEGFLKVVGKGNKERLVPIGNTAQKALQRYLFRFRPDPSNSSIENLFLKSDGYAITENSMKLMFARLAERSGIGRLHAHLCRHTFATRFLENGGDIFTLQQILGHTTLEMVKHYVNLASSHVMIQHQRYSPMDRLKLVR